MKDVRHRRAAMQESPPIVVVFAATDPTGGAGLAADILAISCTGCHPAPVVTAITIQDTQGVKGVVPLDASLIEEQARALLEDMPVSAFKVGLAASAEAVAVISEILADYPQVPLVVDPVLASGGGDTLMDDEAMDALTELLIPQASIITPNSIEARRLAGDTSLDVAGAAQALLGLGAPYVLVTGTHEPGEKVVNTLFGEGLPPRHWRWERLQGSFHGSGCTLAAAIASVLAQGAEMEEAVEEAQEYTWHTLKHAFVPGVGQAIPNRPFWLQEEE